jgi:hypothetical protein
MNVPAAGYSQRVRTFSLIVCVLGVVLAAGLLIVGRSHAALVGAPVLIAGLVGYARGEGTEAYEQHSSEVNTERAKTSGLSRLRNRS